MSIIDTPMKGLKKIEKGMYAKTITGIWFGYEKTDKLWGLYVHKGEYGYLDSFRKLYGARFRAEIIAQNLYMDAWLYNQSLELDRQSSVSHVK